MPSGLSWMPLAVLVFLRDEGRAEGAELRRQVEAGVLR